MATGPRPRGTRHARRMSLHCARSKRHATRPPWPRCHGLDVLGQRWRPVARRRRGGGERQPLKRGARDCKARLDGDREPHLRPRAQRLRPCWGAFPRTTSLHHRTPHLLTAGWVSSACLSLILRAAVIKMRRKTGQTLKLPTTNKRETPRLVPRNTAMDPCSSVRANREDVAGSYGARVRTLVTHWCDNAARAVTDARPDDSRTPSMLYPTKILESSRLMTSEYTL